MGISRLEGRPLSKAAKIPKGLFFEVNVPARLHAFVQDPDDFHESRPNDAVEEDMHRPSHLCLCFAGLRISEMKAANAARQLRAVAGRGAFWFSRDLAHPGRQDRRSGACLQLPDVRRW
jgi:hypothetical protein